MSKKRFRGGRGGGGGGGRSGGMSGPRQGNGGGGGFRGNGRRGGSRRPRSGGPFTEGSGDPGPMPDFPEPEMGPDGEVTLIDGVGMLELHPNGYGFLRSPENMYARVRTDPFVPGTMIEKYKLRQGVMIKATVQPGRKQQGPRVREIVDVDGMLPDDYVNVKAFEAKTPINPEKWFQLETGAQPISTRVLDLLAPLGRGQRALIVAPPRSGKTILLQQISNGISTNYPDVKLIVLLIDERPEEVTDMQRTVKGEVVASSLDMDVESHVRISQLIVERCKRLAEMGKDVFLLLDSITRLARAFNKWVGSSGPVMSGGVNIKAMDIPKKLFATARAFEEGGSLTIVGTALIDTDSKMDGLIFQEFKGTGNMELVLDRRLAERRVFPAIDLQLSGTRREELLLSADTLTAVTALRRTLNSMNPVDAMEQLVKQLSRFKTNAEFIQLIRGKAMND
jgi:transcription termination factor Rho